MGTQDLDRLIRTAESEVVGRAQRPAPTATHGGPGKAGTVGVGVVLLALFVGCVYWLVSISRPPPKKQVAEDLRQVLSQARDSVEASRDETGTLPPALPDAALAALADYEVEGDKYRLSATLLGVRVSMEWDGKVHEDGAAP